MTPYEYRASCSGSARIVWAYDAKSSVIDAIRMRVSDCPWNPAVNRIVSAMRSVGFLGTIERNASRKGVCVSDSYEPSAGMAVAIVLRKVPRRPSS